MCQIRRWVGQRVMLSLHAGTYCESMNRMGLTDNKIKVLGRKSKWQVYVRCVGGCG